MYNDEEDGCMHAWVHACVCVCMHVCMCVFFKKLL